MMQFNYNSLVDLFEGIVEKYPNRIAIKDCTQSYTYQELRKHASGVAKFLLKQNIKSGDRIVCISKKNTDSIICFWGILMCGGVPVILDHDDGMEINEGKINAVLAHVIILDKKNTVFSEAIQHKILLDFEEVILLEQFFDNGVDFSSIQIPAFCYLLLTSGTSGIPKAVQVSHQNVLHYTYSSYEKIGSPEYINAAHVTTFSADLGLTNLLIALISGGMLRILNKEESTDPVMFNKILKEDEISLVKMTPSHLQSIIFSQENDAVHLLKYIILGGEKLSWTVVQSIFALNLCENLYNHYGPTETTIGATMYKIDKSSLHLNKTASVPIGAPIGKGICFLNDETDNIGELYISGPGLSHGYFGSEKQNGEKFVTLNYNGDSLSCFRTGDFCRRLDDGNYEFLYRTDRQVKIRGHRIELGEVEVILNAHPDIDHAIVALSDHQDRTVLEAYIQLGESKELKADALKTWMQHKTPGHKIPSNFYFYKTPPYNSNGKIDFKTLKEKFSACHKSEVQEKHLVNSWANDAEIVWQNILNVDHILYTDNFFDMGGDSLLAIQAIGRLQRNGYKIHISDLNNCPLFEDFILLNPERQTIINDIPVVAQGKRTISQDMFLIQEDFNRNLYCQTILLETTDKIQIREVSLAIYHILKSHPQLTTEFSSQPKGMDLGRLHFSAAELGTTILDNQVSIIEQIQLVADKRIKEMSIVKGELFKVHLFIDPTGKDYLFIACHHLAVDVISWNIILGELFEYYQKIIHGIAPIIITENAVNLFYDFLTKNKLNNIISRAVVSPEIFKISSSGTTGVGISKVCSLLLPQKIAEALKLTEESSEGVTLAGILFGAFAKTILEEFRIDKISIDVEYHGRPQEKELPDLSRSVSWWATTVPLNLVLSDTTAESSSHLLKSTSEYANTLNLFNNECTKSRSEHPDIRFNYLGHFPDKYENDSITMIPSAFNPGGTRSKDAQQEYKLFFTARCRGNAVIIDLQYHTSEIENDTVDHISETFFSNIKSILRHDENDFALEKLIKLDSNMPSVGQPLYQLNFGNGKAFIKTRKNIFVTGATGFLGIFLIKELLRNKDIHLFCLVRGKSQLLAENRLEDCFIHYFNSIPADWKERIHVFKGDLLENDFGISSSDYEILANLTDQIIHAAADINLAKDYSDLVGTNVNSTERIVKFANKGKLKEIHYVSTLAVSGYSTGNIYTVFTEDDFNCGQLFISNYEKTKFEAEKLIRKFFDENGTGRIYRSSHIAADLENGKFQRNTGQNRIFQIIKGMLILKQIPKNYLEEISFSYVDIIARGIVNSCMDILASDKVCLHMENDSAVPFSSIVKMLQNMGYTIETVELSTFRRAIIHFEGLKQDREIIDLMSMWIERYFNFPRKISYSNRYSADVLAQSGLYFPKVDYEWFVNMINEGIKAGYLQLPSLKKENVSVV